MAQAGQPAKLSLLSGPFQERFAGPCLGIISTRPGGPQDGAWCAQRAHCCLPSRRAAGAEWLGSCGRSRHPPAQRVLKAEGQVPPEEEHHHHIRDLQGASRAPGLICQWPGFLLAEGSPSSWGRPDRSLQRAGPVPHPARCGPRTAPSVQLTPLVRSLQASGPGALVVEGLVNRGKKSY